jgi:trimethylamine--corrinoid protein Co-methyltransferase
MKVLGTADVLTQEEIDQISEQALRILAEVGVKIPNKKILEILADHGLQIDLESEMAFFSHETVERFLSESERASAEAAQRLFRFSPDRTGRRLFFTAGAYPQYYSDPISGKVQEHTSRTAIEMTHLADKLDNIHTVYGGMGVPSDVPSRLMPLYMRLTLWKYTRKGWCGKIELTELLPYILDMCQVMAESQGRPVSDYALIEFQMISPLQYGREELEQFLFFWERGLPASVGHILSSGGTAPATLAGTMSLQLAESLVLNYLARVFYGRRHLVFGNSATVLDLKTGTFQYGRPELGLTHLAFGQIARYYGAFFGANCFLGDAKVPSCEMGMQKALNAIPAIMAGSHTLGTLGLLSVDEIGSPIQLIIDNEYAGALQRLAQGFAVNNETLAFDAIREVGPGGNFMGTKHTVRHFRTEHWQPSLFSREMFNAWMSGDHKSDVERAVDVYKSIMASTPEIYLDEDTEAELLKVIDKANRDVGYD